MQSLLAGAGNNVASFVLNLLGDGPPVAWEPFEVKSPYFAKEGSAIVDTAKPYFPYAHYSYRVWRFRLLQELNPGSWVTPEAVVKGATAQQKYSLPIHFPNDAPPDCWFLIYVGDNVPRLIKQEGPETYTNFGIIRTRTGGGTGVKLYSAIPPTQITGPFEFPP